jgi:DNA-binding NarL/FixJ family response regulator
MTKIKTKSSAPAARVLIVDDHPSVREALGIRIAKEDDLEVCGEAADLAEALRVADATEPDIAIVDVALKSASGIDLIKRLKDRHEDILVLVWSMYSDDLYAERALRAGARGYINKAEATDKLVEAIRQLREGKIYLSPALTERLLERHVGPKRQRSPDEEVGSLSDRELDVFRLIGEGMKTAEIAGRLHLSAKTVETYRERIRAKLGLSDGTKLSFYAMQWLHRDLDDPAQVAEPGADTSSQSPRRRSTRKHGGNGGSTRRKRPKSISSDR